MTSESDVTPIPSAFQSPVLATPSSAHPPAVASLHTAATVAERQIPLDTKTAAAVPRDAIRTEETEPTTAEDEPYDPEDELGSGLELDAKNGARELGTEKRTERAAVAGGDEPYDPEDDFVMDLIEDISLPTSLKKIDKPNVSFDHSCLSSY